MDESEAKLHMKRCVDSGLWIPDAKAAEEEQSGSQTKPEKTEDTTQK